MFVDSHCHLTYEPISNDVEKIINECKINKINKLLTIATDLQTSKDSILIADKYTNVFCTIGMHPCNTKAEFDKFEGITKISQQSRKIIGIGETGLDYYRLTSDKAIQIESFYKHIELADKLNIPLIIHNRNADEDLINIISENVKKKSINFLIHCFTGTMELAKNFLDLNCFISFSGIITFKNSHDLRDVVKYVPLEKMMIETDSPFLSPEPFRGKSNTPSMVKYVAKTVADIKKISIDEVGSKTSYNFDNFFLKNYEN